MGAIKSVHHRNWAAARGFFATWQAEAGVIGIHDRNTLRFAPSAPQGRSPQARAGPAPFGWELKRGGLSRALRKHCVIGNTERARGAHSNEGFQARFRFKYMREGGDRAGLRKGASQPDFD